MQAITQIPQTRHRASGVLLHLTSLPGAHEHGALGAAARRWIDLIADAGFTVWQILPVDPPGEDGSPYCARSAHAGHVGLIDLDDLQARGWIASDARPHEGETLESVRKRKLLEALIGFENRADEFQRAQFEDFLEQRRDWLGNDALFLALRAEHQGAPWWEWRADLRDRKQAALVHARERHHPVIEQFVFEQFLFTAMAVAARLRTRTRRAPVRRHPDLRRARQRGGMGASRVFPARRRRKAERRRRRAAGLLLRGRPDLGQPALRLGAPEAPMASRCGDARIRTQLERFDLLRIDHFRGLESYWEIPAAASTARDGAWRAAARRGAARAPARGAATAAARRRGSRRDHAGRGGPARSFRTAGHARAAVRIRRIRRERLPAAQPRAELHRVHGHARQRHDARLVFIARPCGARARRCLFPGRGTARGARSAPRSARWRGSP